MTEDGKAKLEHFRTAKEDHTERIRKEDFAEMLLDNFPIARIDGFRYFQGVHIGAEIYMIRMLPNHWESGNIEIDPKTDWITKGTKLVLSKCPKTC